MAQVRMLVDISGGRADGTEWPRYGEILVCGDGEAEGHVAAGRAERVDSVPAEPPAGGAEPAAAVPAAAGTGDDTPGPENGSQDDDEPADPSKPRVRDPKEAWEQHAVTNFQVHPAAAASMTKAELIAQFGGTA